MNWAAGGRLTFGACLNSTNPCKNENGGFGMAQKLDQTIGSAGKKTCHWDIIKICKCL